MKQDIICPPFAPVLMESIRAIGYSIESAIADIVDNSITAQSKNIEIYYDTITEPFIAILDDGLGMTSNKLTEAMRYGCYNASNERDEDDLGRYGLGMKTASLSQCRCLTVLSKKEGMLESRQWSLEHVINTKEWSLKQFEESELEGVPKIGELNKRDHGTLVIWQSLDKVISGSMSKELVLQSKMYDVQKHLELVFHRYLSGDGVGKINIYINGIKLLPFDPFLASKSTITMDDEKIEIPGRKGKVIVRPYVLPHPSKMSKQELEAYGGKDGLRNLQGFYIYRNKRLLTWGTWFRIIKMDEFTKLARVRVDIPNSLDDLWTLDIKKSTAYPPEVVKTRLRQLINVMSNGSKKAWSFRRRKEIADNTIHVWEKIETREGVKYAINSEYPVLEVIKERIDNQTFKMLQNYLDTIQNNLPFNNLHYDMNADIKIAYDKEDVERTRVKDMAREIIRSAFQSGDIENAMNGFEKIEPFMYYMDDIERIYYEVKRNV